MTEPTVTELHIPAANEGKLEKRMRLFGRQARKLGLPEPVIVSRREEPIDRGDWLEEAVRVTVHSFGVQRIGGWEILGSVTPHADGFCLVNLRKGCGVDAGAWIQHDMSCDHCGHKRKRGKVVLIRNESGEIRSIGSTCLKDFIGVNPDAALFDLEFDLSDCSKSDEGFCKTRAVISPLDFLTACATTLRVEGGYVKAMPNEDDFNPQIPTVSIVSSVLFSKDEDLRRQYASAPSDSVLAEAALADWQGIDPLAEKNDFRAKLAVLARGDWVPWKAWSVLAGGLWGWMKARERQAAEEKKRADAGAVGPSQFVGKPGERITIKVTVERVSYFVGSYGPVNVVSMRRVGSPDRLVWFATGTGAGLVDEHGGAVPGEHSITATVKDHKSDPKWGNQTILTRVR